MNEERGTVVGRQLHLCDFDGTLVRADSLLHFLLFAVSVPRLAGACLVLMFKFLALFFSGNWSNSAGKAAVASEFFKGKTALELHAMGAAFCQRKLPALMRGELLEKLRMALRQGDTVVIVSASFDLWLRPFCVAEGFDLLCTELEFEAGRFTGKFATPNCNGAEKARRIQEAYELTAYEKTCAYGNSAGDAAMFALADDVFKF